MNLFVLPLPLFCHVMYPSNCNLSKCLTRVLELFKRNLFFRYRWLGVHPLGAVLSRLRSSKRHFCVGVRTWSSISSCSTFKNGLLLFILGHFIKYNCCIKTKRYSLSIIIITRKRIDYMFHICRK